MSDLFSERLIIMNKTTQPHPAGGVAVTWSEGAQITAKMQISNMLDIQIAMAQGVQPTGFLVVDKQYEPYITLNTYLKWPKSGVYIRVADAGVIEAGEGVFNERQYAVELVTILPK